MILTLPELMVDHHFLQITLYSYTDYEIAFSSPDKNLFKFRTGLHMETFLMEQSFHSKRIKFRVQPYF